MTQSKTDLSDIPLKDLKAEISRRVGKLGGRPKTLAPCPFCGKMLSAVERRRACPGHEVPKNA